MPFVGAARIEQGRVQRPRFIVGELVPTPQIDLLEALVGGISVRRQAKVSRTNSMVVRARWSGLETKASGGVMPTLRIRISPTARA